MYIGEAIQARTAETPYITREAWLYPTKRPVAASVKILPTDSPDCCLILSATSKEPRRGWEPQAGDLVADDWIIVGL